MPVLGARGEDRSRTRPAPALIVVVAAELVAGALCVAGFPTRPGPATRADRPAAGATAAPAGRSPSAHSSSAHSASAHSASAHSASAQRSYAHPTPVAPSGRGPSPAPARPGSGSTGSGSTGSVSTGTGTGSGAPSGGHSPTGSQSPTGGQTSAGGGSQVPVVQCRTDLPLAQAPDAPYDFLCEQGGAPVTWSTNHIVIFQSGLTVLQSTSLSLALVQWEVDARFQVSFTPVRAAANVTITGAPLAVDQPGYVEDGYTTVSYRCAPLCSYDSAAVELSTTAQLLQTDWVATILHELGHVAGLNHVSRPGEVMYPYLTALSPAVYTTGDAAGLSVLAAVRGA